MVASSYVTGTHVASVERDPLCDGRTINRVVDLTHAVARPTVDGLDEAVCGALVTTIPDLDWQLAWGAPRCEECQRVAG